MLGFLGALQVSFSAVTGPLDTHKPGRARGGLSSISISMHAVIGALLNEKDKQLQKANSPFNTVCRRLPVFGVKTQFNFERKFELSF
jgi:hypothetical protein